MSKTLFLCCQANITCAPSKGRGSLSGEPPPLMAVALEQVLVQVLEPPFSC